jgi:phosphate transport system ATP-binding protein
MELKTIDLSVSYLGKQAVKPVSLCFYPNTVTALIGPSGCGKTTFLRSLNRMNDLIPQARVSGDVLIDDVNIYNKHIDPVDVRRRIGMVFQRSNPFPKSIFENVAYGLRIGGINNKSELDDRVAHALEQAALFKEVKDRLNDSAMGLSGGQQQRLCIARALVVCPSVLLMDEPCSALDPIATTHIEELIRELSKQYTIISVTHNLQQAMRISNFTAFFYMGELIEYGVTEAMFNTPKNDRTKNYVEGRFG